MDIQRVGAQELDVNVVPADIFEQDTTDPKNPVLRLRDWLLDIRTLHSATCALDQATIADAAITQEHVSHAILNQADVTTLTTPTTAKVTNLNSDLHDGYHAGNASGQVPVSNGTVNTNLVAEKTVRQALVTVSADVTLDSNACIIEVTTANAVTLTIPSGLPVGHQYRIKRTVSSANGIAVVPSGSETVEGLTSFTVQGSKVSDTRDTGEVVLEKISSTAWAFVGGQISGSYTNGSWIKFSDGTMICYGRADMSNVIDSTMIYDVPRNFPASFIEAPMIQGGQVDAHNDLNAGAPGINFNYQSGLTSSTFRIGVRLWSTWPNVFGIKIAWVAIGRWKE